MKKTKGAVWAAKEQSGGMKYSFQIVDSKIREEGRGKESCELLSSGGCSVHHWVEQIIPVSQVSVCVLMCKGVRVHIRTNTLLHSSRDLSEGNDEQTHFWSKSQFWRCVCSVCMCYSIISLGNLHPQCQGRVAICRNEKWVNCVVGEKYRMAQQEITQIK